MSLKKASVFLSLILTFSFQFALASINEAFEKIKDNARHYKDPGAVCEEVAREEFSEKYPAPRYEVLVGVAYNVNGRTLGELDMVVIDTQVKKATLVGEVKCYSNLKKGLTKAKQQRKRFLSTISNFKNIDFLDLETEEKIAPEVFKDVRDFISVSQKGGVNVGFDYELSLSLDEMTALRDRMIHCQKDGPCPLP